MERMEFLGIDMVDFCFVFQNAFDGVDPQEYFILDCVDDETWNCHEDAIAQALHSLGHNGHLAIKLGYEPVGGASVKSYMSSKDRYTAIAWQSFRLKKMAEGALDCWKKYQERW